MKPLYPVGEPWFHPDMACLSEDPDLFFCTDQLGLAAAKAVCAECPVAVVCRQKALENREEHGVWGGLTAEERKELVLMQQRSQRRKKRAKAAA